MTPCDTGPLVSLVNAADADHARCIAALTTLPGPLVTTWPCFTEAMYLLYKHGGYPAQRALWSYVEDRILRFYELSPTLQERMVILMERYRDRPMDLADASLVAAAEELGERRLFALDRDFFFYRYRDRETFEVVPGGV